MTVVASKVKWDFRALSLLGSHLMGKLAPLDMLVDERMRLDWVRHFEQLTDSGTRAEKQRLLRLHQLQWWSHINSSKMLLLSLVMIVIMGCCYVFLLLKMVDKGLIFQKLWSGIAAAVRRWILWLHRWEIVWVKTREICHLHLIYLVLCHILTSHPFVKLVHQVMASWMRELELHHVLVLNTKMFVRTEIFRAHLHWVIHPEVKHLLADFGGSTARGSLKVHRKRKKTATVRSNLFHLVDILDWFNGRHLFLPLILHCHRLLLFDFSHMRRGRNRSG